MALRQATAYALRTRPLGEADLIVELFTRERGRIRGVARSARRIKSRFGSAFEPFTLSRMVYFQRDKDDLGRISSCEIERSYFETLAGLEEAAAAAYMAELVMGFSPEHDPSEPLFRLIGATLGGIEAGMPIELVLRYFELWVLRLAGLLPGLGTCGHCGRSMGNDAWLADTSLEFICGRSCGDTIGRRRLNPGARQLMLSMLRHSPAQLADQEPTPQAVGALGSITEMLVCGHLDRMPRSLRYMRQLKRHLRAG